MPAMATNAMRPAHNAKVPLSERRVPLSGHSFAVIVQPSHGPHPATSRHQAWLECCFIYTCICSSSDSCPWSGSRSPDQGLFCVQLRSFSANRTGREEYQGRTKKGLARNKCALLTRGKPSNRRKLRILLHSFSAWLTPPKQVTSAPDLAQDTRSGAFYFAFPHPAACPRFDQFALKTSGRGTEASHGPPLQARRDRTRRSPSGSTTA